jgi:phosphohistidine swiveling domain-containing protein
LKIGHFIVLFGYHMAYKLIEKYKQIIKDEPLFSVRAAISPLFMVIVWQDENYPLDIFCITRDRDSTISINEKNYVAIATDRFREYFQGKVSIQELQDEYDIWGKRTCGLYEKLTDKNIDKLSDKELQAYVHKVNDLLLEMAKKTIYIENVDLEKIISVTGSDYKEIVNAIWERGTEAVFISFENRRLKKILDLINSGTEKILRKVKFIYTDYFWTKSEKEISSELESIRQNITEKAKEYETAYKLVEDKKKKHKAWLQDLDHKSRKIAEFFQLVMRMRDERKDPFAQIQAMLAELSVEMLQRAGIDVSCAPYVLIYEYMKGISHLAFIKNEIEKRKLGCIYLGRPGFKYQTENCDFEEALKQFGEVFEHKDEKVESLKGTVACKGNVKGTVRVVLDPHDDKGFKPGDILVTSMTRPEFVPLMKKAGAVVTNEGGITCHAAIVSRELNIPCIIGTKIATKVFKDGDVVEVDAEKGIVKIIKK